MILSAQPGKGGTAAVLRPFELVVSSEIVGETAVPRIRVVASTLAGGTGIDIGFSDADDPPYLLEPAVGILAGGFGHRRRGVVPVAGDHPGGGF